tara:strand:+ start:1755 stop:4574 length:2820 start_codon:yes stop_codon:yes gene_type:complete
MQVDCNKIRNEKAIRLWTDIDEWTKKDSVRKNIKSPHSAAMIMFESRFHMPIEAAAFLSKEQGGLLTKGNINAFIKDLNKYADQVSSGKFTSFSAAEGFMTGTILGKKDPLLGSALKDIRNIVENDSKRSRDLNKTFNSIIKDIKSSGGITGPFSKVKLNLAINKHRKLELNYTKALDSGDRKLINETKKELTDFENTGSVKDFTGFIKIIEKTMPDALKFKYNEEVELANSGNKEAKNRIKEYDNGTKLLRLSDADYTRILPKVGVPQDLINPVLNYNELMTQSYRQIRNGINKVIDSQLIRIKNRPTFKETSENLDKIREKLLSELMPKYKEDGYFPHFTSELNASMMQGLMKPIDDLTKSNIDMLHQKQSIDEIIDGMDLWVTNHAKARSQGSDYDYSKNFVDVIDTYINNVNSFNTTAFLNNSFMDNLIKAKDMYNEESEYSGKIIEIMDGLYGSINGDSRNSGTLHEIKKSLLAYQFINKLGISPRSALRNSTQFLMNLPTFTMSGIRSSLKYLKENPKDRNVEQFLKDANLWMDTSEAAVESGVGSKSSSPYKIRKIDENGNIQYVDEENYIYKGVKIFSKGVSKIATKTSGIHRYTENVNRSFTAKIAFGQINKLMDESIPYKNYLNKLESEGKITSATDERNILAKNYAKNMVILNHFDYESYAKAKNLRKGVGQFLFQFQHYGMEFLERNWSIYKEAKGDYRELKKGEDKFADWFRDARGFHKSMNMGFAYFLAPALISYISGYNQTLVEHVGAEILEDLYLLMFSDYDNEDEIEKINRQFYGKGIIGSKLGPTVGTIFDIGIATELINGDDEFFDNILVNTGDFTNDDNTDVSVRNIKFFNQFLGRTYDRYIPMSVKQPYGPFSSLGQESTFYPKKQSDRSLYRDIKPFIENTSYYFDRLEKKSKTNKYYGMSPEMKRSLMKLEKAGKR